MRCSNCLTGTGYMRIKPFTYQEDKVVSVLCRICYSLRIYSRPILQAIESTPKPRGKAIMIYYIKLD